MGGGEAQQSPSAAVLAPGQGLEWKAAKAQAPSALQFLSEWAAAEGQIGVAM